MLLPFQSVAHAAVCAGGFVCFTWRECTDVPSIDFPQALVLTVSMYLHFPSAPPRHARWWEGAPTLVSANAIDVC
jgi:hypothetical protein